MILQTDAKIPNLFDKGLLVKSESEGRSMADWNQETTDLSRDPGEFEFPERTFANRSLGNRCEF